ncbi:MFS transporter [Myroides sp. mNGS23_01]|nr:MFS transporter [Myroides sp. mNGS23_01]WHT38541.1 MFS transporter [Myroides sp. mNGS23_01]
MKAMQLGLKENWKQFTLLVVVNMMVGGMVGLERTVVPLVGTEEFHIQSDVVVFSFIMAFGVVKAFTNLISGVLADQYTRKKVLILGWLIGVPVPFLLAYGPSWDWVLFANILLGISQGLAWSMTVNMKIDLVGSKSRGLAMGLNEAAGYGAVGLTALVTGIIAARYGLRPAPFYLGIAYTLIGLLLSIFVVRDTRQFAQLEAKQQDHTTKKESTKPNLWWVFKETTCKNKNLFSISQAGLINNLNDGMSWGYFLCYLFLWVLVWKE